MDPVTETCLFFAKLPLELRFAIMTFTVLLQMGTIFDTNDYDEMAKHVACYGIFPEVACTWLVALVSN